MLAMVVVGGDGGVTAHPHLLRLRHEISMALCSLPVENESGNRVNCT